VLFNLYRRTASPKYRAVKQGFSWPAFVLTGLWLLAKRMYLFGVLYTGLWGIAIFSKYVLELNNSLWLWVVSAGEVSVWLLLGVYGNRIWQWYLLRSGYEKVAVNEAETSREAISQHLEQEN
jgi:hypothetical protein